MRARNTTRTNTDPVWLTVLEEVRHISLTVDTEEVEPIVHVQTHWHNGVMSSTRAVAPSVVLRALLLLGLLHHFCPSLRVGLVKLSVQRARHLLLRLL